jgi:hypothetical protein
MNKDSDCDSVDFANETSRLLSGLNRAVDHSSALRDIIRRQEALQELENITGSSRKAQSLRREIGEICGPSTSIAFAARSIGYTRVSILKLD